MNKAEGCLARTPFGCTFKEEQMLRRFLTGIACLAALAVAVSDASAAGVNRWGAGYFPDLSVVTQDGKTLHFYDDLIKGKIVVINFIYTS